MYIFDKYLVLASIYEKKTCGPTVRTSKSRMSVEMVDVRMNS